MIFRSYGLFWRVDEIDWHPGSGKRESFRLLGRNGTNRGKIQICDFRRQVGIYILYGNYGPHYVGLARHSLGNRLRDHLGNKHHGLWDRFSWFGFRDVLSKTSKDGFRVLKEMSELKVMDSQHVIRDAEALLIKAMALNNINEMKFVNAKCWEQIKLHEVGHYLEKL